MLQSESITISKKADESSARLCTRLNVYAFVYLLRFLHWDFPSFMNELPCTEISTLALAHPLSAPTHPTLSRPSQFTRSLARHLRTYDKTVVLIYCKYSEINDRFYSIGSSSFFYLYTPLIFVFSGTFN